ncbi:MAG: UbiA family prenyltransferase [Sandaracinaceae bacterium]
MSVVSRLVSLARPRGAVLISSLPLVGYGFGLWERGSDIAPWYALPTVLGLVGVWVIGHAGAMWLNAELDRDEGAVLFGEPVVVPRGTAALGYAALAVSVSLAFLLSPIVGGCAVANAVLSVLYSHPGVALKGHPFGGPLVNGAGYGTLSPIAGWAVSGTPFTWRTALVVGLGAFFVLGVYFSAQAFQQAEDGARGYRTLVVTHGPRATLVAARACLLVSSLGMSAAALWGAFPRVAFVSIPVWLLADRHLVRWRDKGDGGTGQDSARLVGWLALGILVGIVAVYVDHFVAMSRGAPLGGCGTAIVPDALVELCARRFPPAGLN